MKQTQHKNPVVAAIASPYMILVSAVLMQMCLGATYSWSVFVSPMRSLTGVGQGTAQWPLTIFYFIFPFTVIFSQTLIRKLGLRLCAIIGAFLFGGGWILSMFGAQHFIFVILGIGLMSGIGVGFAYLVPITTCIQWFPEKKGLVTGIAVAGFGGGAFLLTQVASFGFRNYDMTPFQVFGIFGIVFIVVISVTGLFMRFPPESQVRFVKPLPISEVARMKSFQILYVAMFVSLAAGIGINGNLKDLYVSEGAVGQAQVKAGVLAVGLFALMNAAGRIIWGILFDKFSPKKVLRANMLCQAAVVLSSYWILQSPNGLKIFALLTGFNYGGVLVLYASSVAHIWGSVRVGQIYGWVFFSNVPASLSPALTGWSYDLFGSFTLPLLMMGLLLLLTSFWIRSLKDLQ